MHKNSAEDWQAYWQGNQAADNRLYSGTDHPAVSQFWHKFFETAGRDTLSLDYNLSLLDVASGGGAVLEHAARTWGMDRVCPLCLDISASAVTQVRKRWPAVRGVVADACQWPFELGSVDIAASQYGVEYAGINAIGQMANSVRSGGYLVLLLHYRDGAIYQECARSLQAINGLQESRFVELSLVMFRDAFGILQGNPRDAYETSSKKLIPAFRQLESIMQQLGKSVANGLVSQLYRDVDHIHTNLPNFQADDVSQWLSAMRNELHSFSGRMRSMCDVALDAREFSSVSSTVEKLNFDIKEASPLRSGDNEAPLGWVLIAKRNESC